MEPSTGDNERPRALLTWDFVDVACPVAAARQRLCGRGGWLGGMADQAGREGDALMARIGPTWAHGLLARKVVVQLGPCRERGRAVVVPIEWRAADHAAVFPVLSGDLEVDSLGEDMCRVVLSASYLPPLGELGQVLDRALLHRVAESTVRSFLRQLAASLEAEETARESGTSSTLPFGLASEGGT